MITPTVSVSGVWTGDENVTISLGEPNMKTEELH